MSQFNTHLHLHYEWIHITACLFGRISCVWWNNMPQNTMHPGSNIVVCIRMDAFIGIDALIRVDAFIGIYVFYGKNSAGPYSADTRQPYNSIRSVGWTKLWTDLSIQIKSNWELKGGMAIINMMFFCDILAGTQKWLCITTDYYIANQASISRCIIISGTRPTVNLHMENIYKRHWNRPTASAFNTNIDPGNNVTNI